MLSEKTYLKIVKMSAVYDLVITAAFATPWSFAFLIGQLALLHNALDLPGEVITPGIFVTLFANFFGTVVVIWSIYRLRFASVTLGRYDAAARILFSIWQANALLAGASLLLLPVLAIELALGFVQFWPVKKAVPR